jgi:peptide/nickel transport system ATP-binding protein
MMTGPALRVEQLGVLTRGTRYWPVRDVTFEIEPGEVLALVGESGAGKTTVGLALLGHARRGLEIAHGTVWLGTSNVLAMSPAELAHARGRLIAYVAQDPAAALNPALSIGTQLLEILVVHRFGSSTDERRARVAEMLREVALPADPDFLGRYPHELSGGQQQRVGLAMAFACRPRVIVLDEPTTGLDATTQSQILRAVGELTVAHDTAVLYISHDLAVVSSLARRVAVMYAGSLIELGPAFDLFRAPVHPYMRRLVRSMPHMRGKNELVGIAGQNPSISDRPPGCVFAPRCEFAQKRCAASPPALRPIAPGHDIRCVRAEEMTSMPLPQGEDWARVATASPEPMLSLVGVNAGYGKRVVLHDINLQVGRQEWLAIVGASGTGKTTLARSIAGLHANRNGQILLDGRKLAASARNRSRRERQSIQYVFQNPFGSLNPRRRVGQILAQPFEIFRGLRGPAARAGVLEMLDRVSLSAGYADRYPEELSGGERQRVAIARALSCNPRLLVCDEVTSALDVSVQAGIVDLLTRLQRDLGLTLVFVTHNLPLVRSVAHRVAVMMGGRIVEFGPADQVLRAPAQQYSRRLLADALSLELETENAGSV